LGAKVKKDIPAPAVTTPNLPHQTPIMSDDHVTLDETTYDVIVLGTSLIPAIVGSALSRVGKKVFVA
jgi:hypothetical protein